MYQSAIAKKDAFYTLLLIQSKLYDDEKAPFIPPVVLYDTVWQFITFPHERIIGRDAKWVKKYNSTLFELPKPCIYPGPRIIHNFGWCSVTDILNGSLHICEMTMVKFIYTLYHSKNPQSYITIHEYTTIEKPCYHKKSFATSSLSSEWTVDSGYPFQYIKSLRSKYMKGIQ